ncbi:hypothetical protein GCM10023176_21000 [Micromonospora coerulea]|uniref:Uncharacterized protein n=1 Tax=Micromonospora coerulea TaxID=47856 RepID=A0ABP8SHW6_9ACTN
MDDDDASLEADLDLLRTHAGLDRQRILWRLGERGEQVVPHLRQIRREGPGRLRAAALEVLVNIGGEALLDQADIAAAERLVRIKVRSEIPTGIDACWNYWICVRGHDQQGIMNALGLAAVRPATFALAASVITEDSHGADSGLFFVTPELNGWTAVIGPWCDPTDDDRHEEIRALVEQLSSRCGEAPAYYFGSQNDGSAWLIAQSGRTIRRYNELSAAMAIGQPLPIERQHLDELGISGNPEDHHDSDDDMLLADFHLDCTADIVAAAMSIDIVAGVSADVVVRGTGLLARVPGASTTSIPPGSYRI